MIQMRWFHYNDNEEPVLQFRHSIDDRDLEWSWWEDVPHEHYEKKLGVE